MYHQCLNYLQTNYKPQSTIHAYITPTSYFTDAECEHICQKGYSSILQPARVQNLNTGKQFIDPLSNGSAVSYIMEDDFLYEKLRTLICKINSEYYNFNLLDYGEPIKFAEYTTNGTSIHVDLGNNNSTNYRKLTVVILLSDPNDYDGGDFFITNHTGGSTMAPRERGKVIIFPSFLMHYVSPITRGKRNTAVAFAYGPPFV